MSLLDFEVYTYDVVMSVFIVDIYMKIAGFHIV